MWSRTYKTKVSDLTPAQVWSVWTDVNQWHSWQDDIEYARLAGEFAEGNSIAFRPKGGPTFSLAITEAVKDRKFTDLTRFPLARMYDSHELVAFPDGVEIASTIRVEGLLAFLWVQLVAKGIVRGLAQQTDRLIKRTRTIYNVAKP